MNNSTEDAKILNMYATIYKEAANAAAFVCRAESMEEAEKLFPFPIGHVRVFLTFNVNRCEATIQETLDLADRGELGCEDWHFEILSSHTGSTITSYRFTGNEKAAIEAAKEKVQLLHDVLETDIEMSVYEAKTNRRLYHGSFDICRTKEDLDAQVEAWEEAQYLGNR